MLPIAITIPLLLTAAQTSSHQYNATLDLHAIHQFDSSLDGGGEVGVTRSGFELRVNTPMTNEDELQFQFQYQQDSWDFSGGGLGALDPWGKIKTVDLSLRWSHKYNENTRWYFGALYRSSYEDTYSNGTVAGVSATVVHTFSPDVTLGVGAGIIEQIREDDRVFPLFVVEWNISEDLRLTSDLSTRFGSRTGVELEWSPRSDWSLGVGISYEYNRFHLDNTGIAPSGAGEATAYPLTLRATYHMSPTSDITFYGGIVYAGNIEVTNSNKAIIQSSDYDPAGTFGILGRFRF